MSILSDRIGPKRSQGLDSFSEAEMHEYVIANGIVTPDPRPANLQIAAVIARVGSIPTPKSGALSDSDNLTNSPSTV